MRCGSSGLYHADINLYLREHNGLIIGDKCLTLDRNVDLDRVPICHNNIVNIAIELARRGISLDSRRGRDIVKELMPNDSLKKYFTKRLCTHLGIPYFKNIGYVRNGGYRDRRAVRVTHENGSFQDLSSICEAARIVRVDPKVIQLSIVYNKPIPFYGVNYSFAYLLE